MTLTCVGAGDRDRTGMTSLEGWGSAIELHPRDAVRRPRELTADRWRRPPTLVPAGPPWHGGVRYGPSDTVLGSWRTGYGAAW